MALVEEIEVTTTKVQEYIAGIFPERSQSDWAELNEIAKLTALRRDPYGGFFISNYWRGPMLYSLVRKLKPSFILELGTGRGYGAFCMAKALVDGDIDGKLLTVDRTPGDARYDWAYVNQAQENEIRNISLNDFWSSFLPASLNERIEFRCGDTASTHKMFANLERKFDLVFIDGDHSYYGVALDFLSAHSISARNAVFVFDDYSAASGYGIRKLINEELSHSYSVKIIDMELAAAHDISVDHKMAICNSEAADVETRFTGPADLRFRYLIFRRWLRNKMVGAARFLRRR